MAKAHEGFEVGATVYVHHFGGFRGHWQECRVVESTGKTLALDNGARFNWRPSAGEWSHASGFRQAVYAAEKGRPHYEEAQRERALVLLRNEVANRIDKAPADELVDAARALGIDVPANLQGFGVKAQ